MDIIQVPFSEQRVMCALVRVLTGMVGDDCGKLKKPNGEETNHPAIYLTSQAKFPQAKLPLLQVSFIDINDEDGRLVDKGLIELDKPDDSGEKDYYPYTSTHMYYTVLLTCQGKGSFDILEKIRGKLRFDSWREKIHNEMYSGIYMQSRIRRTPQLVATEWRDQFTMTMTFSTVSTHVDYDGDWFNVIERLGVWHEINDESDPIVNIPKNIQADFEE